MSGTGLVCHGEKRRVGVLMVEVPALVARVSVGVMLRGGGLICWSWVLVRAVGGQRSGIDIGTAVVVAVAEALPFVAA